MLEKESKRPLKIREQRLAVDIEWRAATADLPLILILSVYTDFLL